MKTHCAVNFLWLLRLCCSQVYDEVLLDDVDLNRQGKAMSDTELAEVPHAVFGFTWNEGDASTLKWRPQGMTSVSTAKKEYMAVSWYGRSQENYSNRGVRISFIDVRVNLTSSSPLSYRHVLLVDESFNTFPDMHAGGLACAGDEYIHVPDSRSGTKKVYIFSTASILSVPTEDLDLFYNYAYIMPRVASYDVSITPSFLSFDWTRNQMLVGTFYQCSGYHVDTSECLSDSHNRMSWYHPRDVNSSSASCGPFFSEMQGAQSSTEGTRVVLWSSSSYGSGHESHLHITALSSEQCDSTSALGATENYTTVVYAPGLEDLHRSGPDSPFLWMLTEFGTKDGTGNSRRVFAADVKALLP